jgi:hypothetical protein
LANEELLTRFAGRYCFNKEIPFHVRDAARRRKPPSDPSKPRSQSLTDAR